jgi:pSer/pThr/pTyr-binding forkhead associated (FHA) protein
MRVRLISLDDGTPPIEISKDLVLVGRKEDCDIQLDHKSVSKLHCIIVKAEGLLLLRDLGSTNGTRVNGQRIRRASLLPNDQLFIASLRFKVQFSQAEESQEPEGYTHQMDAKEVAKAIGKTLGKENDSDADLDDGPLVRANALPDVYDDPPAGRR